MKMQVVAPSRAFKKKLKNATREVEEISTKAPAPPPPPPRWRRAAVLTVHT
jgi:hypothetical protein